MNTYDIIAIIGALAWLPQLIIFINNLLKRPKLEILSHSLIELGYTYFGPILNLTLGFVADKKDAIVNKIEIQLTHEKNEQHTFKWAWLEEILMEIIGPKGEVIPYRKNQQDAIGLKVTTDNVIEKKVGFQIPEIRETGDGKYKVLLDLKNYYQKKGQDVQTLKSSSEIKELNEFINNSFIWKPGKYRIDIYAHIKNYKEIFKLELNFLLKNSDVDTLNKNIETLNQLIENDLFGDGTNIAQWGWAKVKKID